MCIQRNKKSTTKYIENAVVSATTALDKRNIC